MKDLTCEKCGKPVEDSAVFCPHCGAAIFRSAPVTPSAPPPPEPAPAQAPAEEPPEKFDFKKLLPPAAVILAVILALILGWDTLAGIFGPGEDPQLSTQPSTQQTVPSTAAPTTVPTKPRETTAPTTPSLPTPTETEPAPTEPDLSWVVTTSQKMSYEEFFSENRPFYGESANTSWVADDGNTYTINDQLQIFRDGELIYTVPRADQHLTERKLLTADGTHVYTADEYLLLQIELLTGNITYSYSLCKPFSAFACGPDLIYFTASSPDHLLICRYYVPTHTMDILHKIEDAATPKTWFSLSVASPYGSLGDITWTMLNPEMHWFLYDEMQNPNSKYRTIESSTSLDFSEYWEEPRLLNDLSYNIETVRLLETIYADTGIYPLLQGTYHCADGTYTERKGIVDSCWFGTGIYHDHFAPEETADTPPTALQSEPVPVAGMERPSEQIVQDMLQEQWHSDNDAFELVEVMYSPAYVYLHTDGGTVRVSDAPVKQGQSAMLRETKHFVFYVSTEETIIQADTNGNAAILYSAQHGELRSLNYHYGKLCFVDGDTVVLLDLVECSYQEVVRHPGIEFVSFYSDGSLYLSTVLGLRTGAYDYYPATGVVKESPRYH